MTSRRQNSHQYYQKQKMACHLLQWLLRHLNPIHPWHINLKFPGVKEIKAIIMIILKSLKLPKIEGKKGELFPFKPWWALHDFKKKTHILQYINTLLGVWKTMIIKEQLSSAIGSTRLMRGSEITKWRAKAWLFLKQMILHITSVMYRHLGENKN